MLLENICAVIYSFQAKLHGTCTFSVTFWTGLPGLWVSVTLYHARRVIFGNFNVALEFLIFLLTNIYFQDRSCYLPPTRGFFVNDRPIWDHTISGFLCSIISSSSLNAILAQHHDRRFTFFLSALHSSSTSFICSMSSDMFLSWDLAAVVAALLVSSLTLLSNVLIFDFSSLFSVSKFLSLFCSSMFCNALSSVCMDGTWIGKE